MKRSYRLNPRKGASIAIALLIFLLLSLAGVSALLMASANAGRYSHADENRQAYYSVSSAALLMVDLLDGLTYRSAETEYRETHETQYTEGAEPERVTSDTYTLNILTWDAEKGYVLKDETQRAGSIALPQRSASETASEAAERQLMEAGKLVRTISLQCDRTVPYLSVPQEWYGAADPSGKTRAENFMPSDVSVSFTVTPSDGAFGTVQGKLTMHANYDLTFTFEARSESGAGYCMSVLWTADVSKTETQGETVVTYTERGDVATVSAARTLSVNAVWKKENVTISRGEVA